MRKLLTTVAVFVFTFAAASLSSASETEVLMKMLLKKGVLTQSEYNEAIRGLSETDMEDMQWKKHVDKHITHAEEAGPAIADGLSIAAGITIVGQGTSGNDGNNPPGEEAIDGNISADLEVSAPAGENGEVFVAMEGGEGGGLESDEIMSFWGVNADAGASSALELTEAWFEHSFANNRVTFTIGKLDLTNYFDNNEVANDETAQFLAPGFVNNLAVEFPDSSAAARLTVSPGGLIDISAGVQSGGWEDIAEKDFFIAEADIKPSFGELQGNYRFYIWKNTEDHTELKDASKDNGHGSGYGASIDQQVTDALTLFARAGYQDGKLYEFNVVWSAGLAVSGGIWGRDGDTLGMAYGEARLSGDNEDVLKADGVSPANEGHFEGYYNFTINDNVSISPDIQVVNNAGGDGDFDTVTVGAVRGQFTF